MNIPYDEILTIIRNGGDPRAAFKSLRAIGKSRIESPIWRSIKTPVVEVDILLAGDWLKENIGDFRPTGVYLGLNTANDSDELGSNIEIGMTDAADPKQLKMDWVYHLPRRGERHLIEGLSIMHKAYAGSGLALFADYLFYLGYGGVVLASAIEQLKIRWHCLFIWGFHDGDLGFLARSSPHGVERLAVIEHT